MATIIGSVAGGNWSATTTWVGAVVPGIADDVTLISTSGSITVDGTSGSHSLCRSLNCTGYTHTFTMGSTAFLDIGDASGGSLTFVSGMTTSLAAGSTITFLSTLSGNTLTSAGKSLGKLVFNGAGGDWTQQDNITVTGTPTFTAGTLNGNGHTFIGTSYTGNGGTFNTGGDLTLTGAVNVSAGALNAAGKIITGGTNLTVSGTGTMNVGTATFSGTTLVSGGSLMTGAGLFTSATQISCSGGSLNFGSGGASSNFMTMSGAGTRSVDLGTGTITLTSTGTVWNATTTTNLTFTAHGSTIHTTNTSATGKTFAGGGLTYNNVTFDGAASNGNIIVSGANTFNGMLTISPNCSIQFSVAGSQALGPSATLSATGSAGNTISMVSTIGGTQAIAFTSASATISMDYVTMQDLAASGGANFYSGLHSTSVSGNSGWTFGILGTSTATGGTDSMSAASFLTVSGSSAAAEVGDSMVAAGGIVQIVTGTSAATEGHDGMSASGLENSLGLPISNLVRQSSTSNGTGNMTLFGTPFGYQSFFQAFGLGNFGGFHCISNTDANEWEIGTGHLIDAVTYVRDSVIQSSNNNTFVNFSDGLKDVSNDLPAQYQGMLDTDANLGANSNLRVPSQAAVVSYVASHSSSSIAWNRNLFAGFGDSRINNNWGGGALTRRNDGFLSWACYFTNQAMQFPSTLNYGVSGNTTADLAARYATFKAAIIAAKAGCVAILIGVNDRTAGMTAAQSISNMLPIITDLLSIGVWVFLVSDCPTNGSAAYTTQPQQAYWNVFNRWMYQQSTLNNNCFYVNANPLLIDPASTTGSSKISFYQDGKHPAQGAGMYIGRSLADIWKARQPHQWLNALESNTINNFDVTYNAGGNKISNPLFTFTSGGSFGSSCSGVIADGWKLAFDSSSGLNGTTAVAHIMNRSQDEGGNMQGVTIVGTPTSARECILQLPTALVYGTDYFTGEVWQVSCESFMPQGQIGVRGVSPAVREVWNTSNTNKGADMYECPSNTIIPPTLDVRGINLTPPITIVGTGTGTNQLNIWLSIQLLQNQAVNATVYFGRASINKVVSL